MTPSQYRQIKEIVSDALDLPPAERQAYVSRACAGNIALREQVERLVAASEEPDISPPLRRAIQGMLLSAAYDAGIRTEAGTMPERSLRAEEVIGSRFRILRYVGCGGMGEVYEAEDLTLKDRVALKIIRSEIASDPLVVERFKREILLGKRITHSNVCRIRDLGVDALDNVFRKLTLGMVASLQSPLPFHLAMSL